MKVKNISGSKKPTRSGLYKKKMLPMTKNSTRVSHDMREHKMDTDHQRRKAVAKALSS